jgi:polar amino acid transport system permease protein
MNFIDYFINSIPFFIRAAVVTVELTAAALAIGVVIGLFFAMLKISRHKFWRLAADTYITIIRGTPLIVQLFAIYFGLATIVDFGSFWSAAIALAIHNGAYIAEIFRGGIESIEKGQMEAARSLGMNYFLAMRRIILPQAFRRIIPPLGNQFIIGLKDSSLAAFVTLSELFGISMRLASTHYAELSFYTIAGLYYLMLVIIFTVLVNRLEKWLKIES